jgi:hypothetical protein
VSRAPAFAHPQSHSGRIRLRLESESACPIAAGQFGDHQVRNGPEFNHGQDDQSASILVIPGGYILQIVLDHGSKDLVPKGIEVDRTRNRIRLGLGMFFAERHDDEAHWNGQLLASQVGLWYI